MTLPNMPTIKRLIPFLICKDIPAEHDFLVDTFGFSSGGINRTPEGEVVHAEVRAGDVIVWLHRVAPDLKLDSPCTMTASHSGLVVFVDDVDRHYDRVRSRGTKPEGEPKDMPYGQREYGVRDPEGHWWWFATALK